MQARDTIITMCSELNMVPPKLMSIQNFQDVTSLGNRVFTGGIS